MTQISKSEISQIKKLTPEFVQRLFINTQIGAVLGVLINLAINAFDISNFLINFFVIFFTISFNLIDQIIREKNLFYKLKSKFILEVSIFILVAILTSIIYIPLLIIVSNISPNLNLIGRYAYAIILTFIPVTVAYFGMKLKWL